MRVGWNPIYLKHNVMNKLLISYPVVRSGGFCSNIVDLTTELCLQVSMVRQCWCSLSCCLISGLMRLDWPSNMMMMGFWFNSNKCRRPCLKTHTASVRHDGTHCRRCRIWRQHWPHVVQCNHATLICCIKYVKRQLNGVVCFCIRFVWLWPEVVGAPVLLKIRMRKQHDETPRATDVH